MSKRKEIITISFYQRKIGITYNDEFIGGSYFPSHSISTDTMIEEAMVKLKDARLYERMVNRFNQK